MLSKLVVSDPFCHSGDRCHWLQDNHDELHVVYGHTQSRQGRLSACRNTEGVLDLAASGVTLYAVSSPGVTWCTDSSGCCLVIADSVLRLDLCKG